MRARRRGVSATTARDELRTLDDLAEDAIREVSGRPVYVIRSTFTVTDRVLA